MPKKMSARAMLKAKKKREAEEKKAKEAAAKAAAGGAASSEAPAGAGPSSGAGGSSGNSGLADAARAAIDAASASTSSGPVTAADMEERMKKAMDAREKIAETALLGEEMHRRLMDEAMSKINVTYTASKEQHENERDIHVKGLSVTLGPKVLLKDTDLTLSHGNRYGLIGRNGCGKSILMTILGRRQVPIPKHIDSYHLVSEIDPTDMSAIEAVLAVDVEKKSLEADAELLTNAIGEGDDSEETLTKLDEIYERLDELSAETAEKRAASILHGLGFTKEMQAKKTKDFSGGWRMRISLARALFLNPTLLILDEPTNHLDMEAVVWLEDYLAKFKKILLLVSHSQDFLNTVTTHTVHFHQNKLSVYAANYDGFVAAREDKEMHQSKRHEWEQAQIKKMKEYIAKFGHGTKKMAKQAQSKEKTLAKMTREGLTEAVAKEKLISMKFPNPDKLPPPVLQMQNISFGYTEDQLLFKDVDFGVDLDSRIALVGPNGAGKSTLLKLMSGELTPVKGAVRPHPHLRMSRYTQHFVDTLDLEMTPLAFFCGLRPEESETQMRRYLGRFGVGGDMQTETMKYLSDGIKSRVVFAMLALQNPHIILFDEPTNHLDMESIDSLAAAINKFEGGVVLVSHDMRLISQVAEEIWECDAGTIEMFPADIGAYKLRLRARIEKAQRAFEAGEVAGDGVAAAKARADVGGAAAGGAASGGASKASKAPAAAKASGSSSSASGGAKGSAGSASASSAGAEEESKVSSSSPAPDSTSGSAKARAAAPAVGSKGFQIGGGAKKKVEAVGTWR